MQTASSETESKSLDLSICVHHYTLRAPCPKGQGKDDPCILGHVIDLAACCDWTRSLGSIFIVSEQT